MTGDDHLREIENRLATLERKHKGGVFNFLWRACVLTLNFFLILTAGCILLEAL